MKSFLKTVVFVLIIAFLAGTGIHFLSGREKGTELQEQIKEKIEKAGDAKSVYDIDEMIIFDENREILQDTIEKTVIESEETVQNLQLSLSGGIFKIAVSGDESFYVEGKNVDRAQAYVEENTLKIKGMKTKDYSSNMELTVYIPAEYRFQSVKIDLGAGKLEICDCISENLEIQLGAGEADALRMECDNLKVSVGAGHLMLQDFTVKEYAELNVEAGNIEGTGNFCRNAGLNCSMGAIHLYLPEEETAHNYGIRCAAGQVAVGEQKFTSVTTKKMLSNNSENQIELNCALGNISIDFM